MDPFRQTFVISLVLMMIMVCGVTTQTTNSTATSAIKSIQTTHAATIITSHQSTALPPSTNVQSTQNITYECYSNQTIRLVGSDFVKSYERLIITRATSRSHVSCTGTKESGGGFLIEGKDCFNSPLRGSLTSENNSNIIGGKDFTEFTFECNGLPKNGTFKTVTVKVSSQIVSATPQPAIPLHPQSPSLDLQFTVTDKYNKVASFTDGDEEVLHIKGPAEYFMFLQECTAFNGTSADSSFTNHTLYKDFKSVDLAIIDKAFDGNKGEITIKVYAFHFVGSSDVTYQCTVLICPDTSCHPQTNVSGRKRRATSVRSEQVEASVKVHEKYDLNGKTVSSAERTETAFLVLVASMTLLASFF